MFKVGDMVYVAFAVGWKFETHLTTVKDVVEKDGEVEYIVECYCDAARFSNDMLVGFPIKFMLDGREVTSAKIPRRRWVNQDFLNGDILECTTVNFAYEKGRNGLPKKECLPIYQSFEGMAKIDIKKGILIDGQPIKTL